MSDFNKLCEWMEWTSYPERIWYLGSSSGATERRAAENGTLTPAGAAAVLEKVLALWERIKELEAELADAEAECRCALREIEHLRGALRPFAQPDLARIMGGQHDSTSIVFQRDSAKLAIGDFERAAAALEDK